MIKDSKGNKYLKVGKTNNINKRKHQYKADGYTIIKIYNIFTFRSEKLALAFEDFLRDYFIQKYDGKNYVKWDRFLNGYASKKDLKALCNLYQKFYSDLYNSPLC